MQTNIVRDIDEKVLACEIIKEYETYELSKSLKKDEEERKRQEEWLEFLGQKEYPSNEK